MKRIFTAGIVVIAISALLIIINIGKDQNEPKAAENMNIKQIVYDYSSGGIIDESASITSQKLIVTRNDGTEKNYNLPEDEFFVSIAPYVENTHPCATHSLTGCRGELAGKELDVRIENEDGEIVKAETIKSHPNGFIDLWLPREQKYHITIDYDGKTAESVFSTFEGDNTCISTMQLKEKSA